MEDAIMRLKMANILWYEALFKDIHQLSVQMANALAAKRRK